MRRPAAFTLIELLIALAVAAVLTVMAMQAWTRHRDRVELASARAALVAAMAEQERRHAHSGRYADFSGISEHAPGYALSAQWCDGRTLMQCMEVVAQPARPDTRCGTLILRSTGERFIQAAGVREPAPPACWP
ncbi:type IV pilin protein [uncultured Ralstonia sp.]|jgi:type IV pilus assembly protein PilE|uniref:type IV pilin protein n=1 Tax=Ralstonia sp. TaxID=54061 RepID=UPI001EA5D7D4|nr:prepilin-type N-terminal cleavage/methylation domain-containing protein [uncultured Ralstonia sp.]UCF22825.1 MAG: prepilin-type N-terminal cleavage/methylation domain-containing protein [Ralstonia sp.]